MDILTYAALSEKNFEEQLSETGKTRKTTFWSDFTIADTYGKAAINDTYKRSIGSFIGNVEYIAEFILVLNWKAWEHSHRGNVEKSMLYSRLYEKALNKAYKQYAKDKVSTNYLYDYLD